MKDDRKIRNNELKANYDDRMKAKGLIKACYWHSPCDSEMIARKCQLSRIRHDKRAK